MTIEEAIIGLWKAIGEDPRFEIKPSIDDECVGCCKMVDIAANLQEELDDCRERLIRQTSRIDEKDMLIECLEAELSARNTKITDVIDTNKRLNGFLDEYRETVENRDRTIDELKNKNIEDLKELYALDTKRCDKRVEALEAELSARKGDSEVLMKIIEAAKKWDNSSIQDRYSIASMRGICNIIEDYLDAPESPIKEEEHYIIVDVNSVEDVQPIVEKIAKSIAALTGNHVNARIQFVTLDKDIPPIDDEKITVKVTSGTDNIVKVGWLELP